MSRCTARPSRSRTDRNGSPARDQAGRYVDRWIGNGRRSQQFRRLHLIANNSRFVDPGQYRLALVLQLGVDGCWRLSLRRLSQDIQAVHGYLRDLSGGDRSMMMSRALIGTCYARRRTSRSKGCAVLIPSALPAEPGGSSYNWRHHGQPKEILAQIVET